MPFTVHLDGPPGELAERLESAMRAASEYRDLVWLARNGERIGAVVPPDFARVYEAVGKAMEGVDLDAIRAVIAGN